MKLRKKLELIAISVAATSSSGCYIGVDCETPEPVSNIITLDDSDEGAAHVAELLAEFDAENPGSTANEKLEFLFPLETDSAPAEIPATITPDVRDLIAVAMMEGLSAEACEGMCRTDDWMSRWVSVDECDVPESGIWALNCRGTAAPECNAGRKPRGLRGLDLKRLKPAAHWWSEVAYLEKAAVQAFLQLARDLARLDAPARLIDACIDASVEEIAHARITAAIAASLGAEVPEVVFDQNGEPTLFELAEHNVREGCVRETYAGLEATWQAAHAAEAWRAPLRTIASDECGHAELSWEIDAWARTQLTEIECAALDAARAAELDALRDGLGARVELPQELGLPNAESALRLFDSMCEELAVAA